MVRTWLNTCLLVSVLAFAACSLLPERPAPAAAHDFGPQTPNAAHREHRWSSVIVEAPEWLRDERLHYRLLYREPTRVQNYAKDRWIAPPPDLLEQRLSGPGPADGSGCRLRIELRSFEQVFQEPDRAQVVIQFLAKGEEPEAVPVIVLAERQFALSLPAPSPDAAGAVQGLSRLVEDAVGRLDGLSRQAPELWRCTARPGAHTGPR
jgi:cholesterol transport system auxiliary component